MINRIPDVLPPPTPNGQPSQPLFQELREVAQREFMERLRQVEANVKTHPATAVGAGLCIGIVLGWLIKRR